MAMWACESADMESQRGCVTAARLFVVGLVLVSAWSAAMAQQRMAPAFFIFGDSLADPGNNNYLRTLSRADNLPNGIDFPGRKATGRYCNGKTATDVIGQTLGIPGFIPPYMAPETKGPAVLNGVNYASGAAGILDSSGYLFIGRLSLNKQLSQFADTKAMLVAQMGEAAAADHIAKSLFYSNFGSNDFLDNYFIPGSPFSRNMTITDYTNMVLANYRGQLTALYNMGARKIAVASLAPIGCCPYQLTLTFKQKGVCDDKANTDALNFNKGVLQIVNDMNAQLPGADVTYLDVYRAVGEIIAQPQLYGFTVKDTGCCGQGGPYKGLVPCMPNMTFCANRLDYVFWDPYHPTEKANTVIASRFFEPGYAYPKNLKQLLGVA